MDDYSKCIHGRRGKGRPCPCCAEAPKRMRGRLARRRLNQKDKRLLEDVESEAGEIPDSEPKS